MATYLELYQLVGSDELRNRCATAVVIAARAYLVSGSSTTAQKKWALSVMDNPTEWGRKALSAALAANKDVSVGQITVATDASLQTAVDAIAAAFAEAI